VRLTPHLLAGALIVALVLGWGTFAYRMQTRTRDIRERNAAQVADIIGPALIQAPPIFHAAGYTREGKHTWDQRLSPTQARAVITMTYRRRGTLAYPTYEADVTLKYTVTITPAWTTPGAFKCPYPSSGEAECYNVKLIVDGTPTQNRLPAEGFIAWRGPMDPGKARTFEVRYRARGTTSFAFGTVQDAQPHDVDAQIEVRGTRGPVDFGGFIAPSKPVERLDGGRRLTWHFTDMVANSDAGVVLPELRSGAERLITYAMLWPLLMVGFIGSLWGAGVVAGRPLGPGNVVLLAASYAAFGAVVCYVGGVLEPQLAIAVGLVALALSALNYLRIVAGSRFAVTYGLAACLVFGGAFPVMATLPQHAGVAVAGGLMAVMAVVMHLAARHQRRIAAVAE